MHGFDVPHSHPRRKATAATRESWMRPILWLVGEAPWATFTAGFTYCSIRITHTRVATKLFISRPIHPPRPICFCCGMRIVAYYIQIHGLRLLRLYLSFLPCACTPASGLFVRSPKVWDLCLWASQLCCFALSCRVRALNKSILIHSTKSIVTDRDNTSYTYPLVSVLTLCPFFYFGHYAHLRPLSIIRLRS